MVNTADGSFHLNPIVAEVTFGKAAVQLLNKLSSYPLTND